MFSSEISRTNTPLSDRLAGIVLGSLLLFAAAAALFSARTLAFTFATCFIAFLVAGLLRRDQQLRLAHPERATLYLAAFIAFAFLSTLWARDPHVPLEKSIMALFFASGWFVVTTFMAQESRANLLHMSEGVWIGQLVGLSYLCAEMLTDQGVKIAVFNAMALGREDLSPPAFFKWDGDRLYDISTHYISRDIAPAALLLWPTLLLIRASWKQHWRTWGAIAVLLVTLYVVFMSRHESSKLAVVLSFATFTLASLSLRWTHRILSIVWIIVCLGVVPLALLAYHFDLHQAPWLQASARHRIIIWNETATRTLQSPVIGVGANMTYVLGPEEEKSKPKVLLQGLSVTLNMHSHSAYLQTWFELGLVGAALLMMFGLSLLAAIRALEPPLRRYAYATFVAAASMAAVSYGMWQLWYQALFAFTAVALFLGVQLTRRDPNFASQST